MKVRVVLSLLSRGSPLIIDNKINREKDTFKPNMDIKDSINWWEFKKIYNNIVKIDI